MRLNQRVSSKDKIQNIYKVDVRCRILNYSNGGESHITYLTSNITICFLALALVWIPYKVGIFSFRVAAFSETFSASSSL
jgi:hypothetical protein